MLIRLSEASLLMLTVRFLCQDALFHGNVNIIKGMADKGSHSHQEFEHQCFYRNFYSLYKPYVSEKVEIMKNFVKKV